jgi:hypothetical protein
MIPTWVLWWIKIASAHAHALFPGSESESASESALEVELDGGPCTSNLCRFNHPISLSIVLVVTVTAKYLSKESTSGESGFQISNFKAYSVYQQSAHWQSANELPNLVFLSSSCFLLSSYRQVRYGGF